MITIILAIVLVAQGTIPEAAGWAIGTAVLVDSTIHINPDIKLR